MGSEAKAIVRVSMALDTSYETENSLLRNLKITDESNRGKLLRALVRAGFKVSHGAANTGLTQKTQEGGANDS